MAKPWDETMKKLIYARPQELLDWLKTGGTFLHDDLDALDDLIMKVSIAAKAQEARRFLLGEEEDK